MTEEMKRKMDAARSAELKDIAEHAPTEKARRQMQHKPYAAMLIRAQGEQIEKSGGVYEKDNLDNRVDHSEAVAENVRGTV